MTGLVKKFSLLLFVLSILCLSSCVDHNAIINENSEQMLQCIIDRDAEKLLTYFSEDIRENRTEKTLEEIESFLNLLTVILFPILDFREARRKRQVVVKSFSGTVLHNFEVRKQLQGKFIPYNFLIVTFGRKNRNVKGYVEL